MLCIVLGCSLVVCVQQFYACPSCLGNGIEYLTALNIDNLFAELLCVVACNEIDAVVARRGCPPVLFVRIDLQFKCHVTIKKITSQDNGVVGKCAVDG